MDIHVIQQSQATAAYRRIYFNSTTGLSGTCRISKNGAASAASSGSIVEYDSVNMPGGYYLELTAAECNTLGMVTGIKNGVFFAAMIVPDNPMVAALTASDVAKQVLKEDFAGITGEAERSLINANRADVNAFAIAGGVMTVKKEDDSTTAITRTVTGTPSVTAISGA